MSKIVELKTEEIVNIVGGITAGDVAAATMAAGAGQNATHGRLPDPQSSTSVNMPPPAPPAPRPHHKLG